MIQATVGINGGSRGSHYRETKPAGPNNFCEVYFCWQNYYCIIYDIILHVIGIGNSICVHKKGVKSHRYADKSIIASSFMFTNITF